jgi:hypothetical protein
MNRNRFRRANSSLPGYDDGAYDLSDHPASQAQPSADQYGIDSEFGGGVRQGPYKSGPAPASVGWTPEHPAADEDVISDYAETSELYEANLRKAMERKASKCIEIAESRLGKTASQDDIEDLALRFMDLPTRQINAKLERIASDFLAGDEVQEATGHEGDDDGVANVTAEETASDLAEEIVMLKAANARLSNQMRRLAEDVVQKETGNEGDDESVEVLDSDESEGATKKLASESMAEDMSILAEMMQEAAHMGDSDRMSEIVATMDILAKKEYLKHNQYGEAAGAFGYQDEDKRTENRVNRDSDWNKKVKKHHNEEYYSANRSNKKLWGVEYDGTVGKYDRSKKAEFMAEDILSDEEFANILSEMDAMADESMAGGKGSGGNNNGERIPIHPYGEAAPGFGYQDEDKRIENRVNRDSDWNKKTKHFYNLNYYTKNRGVIDGWPKPKNPRVAEMEAEMNMASEEEAMLQEMLAEMEAEMNMASEDVSNEEVSNQNVMAQEDIAEHHMSDHDDVMGLHMGGEEAGIDPKLARIFQAADDVASEDEASDDVASEDEASEEVSTKKSASFRPQTQARQASVKTLGNISREASSGSDELSKLWESAPDVSKFFG